MTPTDKARRSDALYYDTQNVARRSLCDMIAQRENDFEELQELARILVHCMGSVDRCDTCRINGNPCEVSVDEWFACDGLHERLRKCGVIE